MKTTQTCNRHKMELSKDEPITEENIRYRAERTAVCAMKHRMGFANSPYTRKAFHNLLDDLDNFDVPGYVLTESYEMVQEAVIFLCEHIGKKMSDLVNDRKGEPVTILCACFRVIHAFVQSKARKACKSIYIEDMPEHCFRAEFEWDIPEAGDYTAVKQRIEAMNLTPKQNEVLEYRMAGSNYTDIGQILFENNKRKTAAGKVRKTVIQIQEKYTRMFIEHKPLNKIFFQPDAIFYQADINGLNLTPCQNKIMERYLLGERLSEIARTFSVTRQAAFDAVKKVRIKILQAQTV